MIANTMSFDAYRALDAWGSGSLKAMRRGPPARVLLERDRPSNETDATVLGSAVHCAFLTPELFDTNYAVKPEGMSFATKDGKAWRDDPERFGRTLISHEVGDTVTAIVCALYQKEAVRKSITETSMANAKAIVDGVSPVAGAIELSLLWECSTTHENCKGRPDWMDGEFIYDLKVSRHASGNSLAYRTYAEGWMHQLAHYRTGAIELGLPVHGGRLVVVEPTAPHFVYTLEVKSESLNMLEAENISTLAAMRECRLSGIWPGTPDDWKKVEIPANALALMGIDSDTENSEEAF